MIDGKTILAIIPARGGSKRLPKKNIKILGGKPLISWTIEAARNSKFIDRIIVSTDSNEIAEISQKWGAEVPFIRPSSLATDDASSEDVILHAINWMEYEKNTVFDYFILLQPTSPFRTHNHIDDAIKKITKNCYGDALVSVYKGLGKKQNNLKELTGKQKHSSFVVNGAVYICKINIFKTDYSFYRRNCLIMNMSKKCSIDIDSKRDWKNAENFFN